MNRNLLIAAGDVSPDALTSLMEEHKPELGELELLRLTTDEWCADGFDAACAETLYDLYASADAAGKALLAACRYPLAVGSTHAFPFAAVLNRRASLMQAEEAAIEAFLGATCADGSVTVVAVVMINGVFARAAGSIPYSEWRDRLPIQTPFYVVREGGALETV